VPTEVKLPRLSQATKDAVIVRWFGTEGDQVASGEPLLEVETDKASVEIESPATGTLLKILAQPDATVLVGEILAIIGAEGEEVPTSGMLFPDLETGAESGTGSAPVALDSQDSQQHEPRKQRKRVKATPIARKVARELNVSLDKVTGTGPNRTITQSDVRTFAESRRPVSKGLGETEEVEIVPLAGVRKKMAERMALSQRTQASVTTVAEVDMLSVQDLRKRIDATYTAFVVKAAALALRDFPLINASLRGEYLHYFKRIHINVAIDTERGLLVPVVRDADEKDLMSVNAEIESLACRGREGVLSVEEMQGGTFTVTNSGVLGSLLFTPVINYPQGATLGMGKVEARTVVREDKIVARPMMYLCLSYDHRFIEGATAVRFLQAVKANLEDVVTRMKE
jgi:pyruvate/2-oxoglutarate dehydrogenase complex dihydrolipoamide acyltransferase (E2) component